jgi:hypothetical protein
MVGDLNLDGVMDINDYLQWKQTKGQTGLALLADTDVNGVVDNADLQMWASYSTVNPADLNNDEVVDLWDYNVLKSFWRQRIVTTADINSDGVVDSLDYEVWYYLYNQPDAPLSPTIGGDYDLDGDVDGDDYTAWRNSLATTGAGLLADGNGDGSVDTADYTIWRSNLGATVEPPALVFYAGDCNFDGVVNGADFLAWQRAAGSTSELACDFNGDLQVDYADLSLLQQNLGRGN